MDSYTILSTELHDLAQSLNSNISELQKKADKLQKVINKVTRGDYNASDLSAAYSAQSALAGSIVRLDEICGAINSAASHFSETSAELSGRANLTAYYMQHTSTLSYEGLMGTYTTAITSAGSASAGYEVVKGTLSADGYPVGTLGSVSSAVQDAIQREAEEQARRAEEAKWAKIGLTGLVIVGGIVASAVTGGAAAPIVIGAISGAVMAGGNTAIDQYAERGWDTDKWDYAKIGKDAFVGGVTGAATAWIGGNLTKGVTNYVSGTQWGSTLLNSSNAYARVGIGAVIGSASEVVSGVGSRGTGTFISTMVGTNGDLRKSLSNAKESALDMKQIVKDAAFGGVRGGRQQYKEWKADQDKTDWKRTSLTPEQEKVVSEIETPDELEVHNTDNSKSNPKEPVTKLPSDKKGYWSGDRGNSSFIPNDPKVKSMIGEYGVDSVQYSNNEVDFSFCEEQQTPWGNTNTKVTIGHMTSVRNKNSNWSPEFGNYQQADSELASLMSHQTHMTITREDIAYWREANKLTWHEYSDGKTMQLVPTKINAFFSHTGGVSQKKYEQAWGDISLLD